MARTKQRVLDDHRSAQEKAAPAARGARKRAGILKAAHMLSSQELNALPPVKYPPRAPDQTEAEEAETEEEPGRQVRCDHNARGCIRSQNTIALTAHRARRTSRSVCPKALAHKRR